MEVDLRSTPSPPIKGSRSGVKDSRSQNPSDMCNPFEGGHVRRLTAASPRNKGESRTAYRKRLFGERHSSIDGSPLEKPSGHSGKPESHWAADPSRIKPRKAANLVSRAGPDSLDRPPGDNRAPSPVRVQEVAPWRRDKSPDRKRHIAIYGRSHSSGKSKGKGDRFGKGKPPKHHKPGLVYDKSKAPPPLPWKVPKGKGNAPSGGKSSGKHTKRLIVLLQKDLQNTSRHGT